METLTHYHEVAAACIARLFLGLLFFFQGYDAVFKVKIRNVILAYGNSLDQKGIPRALTIFGAWFTSFAELIGGFLLIIGLFEYHALLVLGIDLIIAAIGFGIMTPVWDMRFVFPRIVLLLFLLVIPPGWDLCSIDNLINHINK